MRCSFGKLKRFLFLYTVIAAIVLIIVLVRNQPFLALLDSTGVRNYANRKTVRYPGAFLEGLTPLAKNESYCTFGYDLPEDFVYEETDLEGGPETGQQGPYRVLYNVVRAAVPRTNLTNSSSPAPVTYATHLTPEFFGFVAEVLRAWDGLVSVAIFVPDVDADAVSQKLLLLCRCMPDMSRVSVHYVFPKQHRPLVGKPADLMTCCMTSVPSSINGSFRDRHGLLYPVNVCRNVAKNASTTHHVLVADVELIPSERMASRFLEAIAKFGNVATFPSYRVYVVPVFEVEGYESVPRTKKQLLRLIKLERAVYFHRHICSHCQKFPGIEQWMDQDPGDVAKIFAATTRVYPYHRWEPVYIGTKNEPFYSEVLSWEGKQDKMTQMLEMCLMGYRFLILDGAFLVHWPGIKRKSLEMRKSNKWRSPYQLRNSRQYGSIVANLSRKYARNPRCKVQ